MTYTHNATRHPSITANDGHNYIMLGETLCHHTDLTDEHEAALDNPRPADT
jgi:hypothetical protein